MKQKRMECFALNLTVGDDIRDLKIQDGREDDGAPKDGKDWD